MPSPAPLFSGAADFRQAFAAGLIPLLGPDAGLGAYILAFNNTCFDPALREFLADNLEARFEDLASRARSALKSGREPEGPADDVAVFLRMLAVGYGELETVRLERRGPWEVQFNPVRAFRPARASGKTQPALRMAFDPAGFHFDKPFLAAETFWSGEVAGRGLDLLYNKFPFAPLQTIVVPDRAAHLPQWLTRPDHGLAWSLAETLAPAGDGTLVGYNSLGAFASVNHLHFHLALGADPMPLMDARWRHNGGELDYPLPCSLERDPDAAWDRIESLQAGDRPFNLIYGRGAVFVLERRRQGDYALPEGVAGQAWYELGGGFVCFDAARFAALTEAEIAGAIARAAPGAAARAPA